MVAREMPSLEVLYISSQGLPLCRAGREAAGAVQNIGVAGRPYSITAESAAVVMFYSSFRKLYVLASL